MRKLILNADALKHNFHVAKQCAPHAKVLSMVKANAYGHGLVWAAEHLVSAGTDALAVAVLEEARLLREAGCQRPIVLMDGFLNAQTLKEALALELSLVLHEPMHLHLLEEAHLRAPLDLWLKVETGMHRLGLAPNMIPEYFQKLAKLPDIRKIGLMTHFSEADNLESTKTEHQIQVFDAVYSNLNEKIPQSLANSAGILAWKNTHRDWVRPGIMLYGASPFAMPDARLKPVMTVKSNVIAIHDLPHGTEIGYGSTFICPRNMRIATVAFGYGDGYPRMAQNSHVWISGKLCVVVGRVSMDMIQVDITEHPEVLLGEEVTVWGEHHPVENLANAANTISYEIFCRMQRHRLNLAVGSDRNGAIIG